MDKKIIGLVGVVTAALAAPAVVQAAPAEPAGVQDILAAQSYADLLNPIPNAGELLRAVDAVQASRPRVEKTQYYYHHHHHHHHHHVIETPFGDVVLPHHHHHHHHHHYDYYEYDR
jgi:hypothetical protein